MKLYNHLTKSYYSFDFDSWFALFDDGSKEMSDWKSQLNYAYHAIYLRNETNNCFQYTLQLNDFTVFLHLNIGYILEHIYPKNNIIKIKLSDIGTNNSNKGIVFFPTNEYVFQHLISVKPAILMQFPTVFGIRHLVIDGNHRITAKKNFYIKSINALIYMPNSEYDFANLFEYTLYKFLIVNLK